MMRKVWQKSAPAEHEMQNVERLLHLARFRPRESLGPELIGRARRGESPRGGHDRRDIRLRSLGVLGALSLIVAVAIFLPARLVRVDRCCFDLDGGGTPDDGLEIRAERDGRVHSLSVYEDRDGSSTLTIADIIRFSRNGGPLPEQSVPAGWTTIRHCCQDLDGGGPADDGVLVIAAPPDRIHNAAIYELR